MTNATSDALRWQVHRYDLARSVGELAEFVSGFAPDLAAWTKARGGREGQRFLLGPDGRPDLRINVCLGSAKWRNLAERSSRDYTYSLTVWLNFLLTRDVDWWEAGEDDAEEFLFWRVTDPENAGRVQTNSFSRDLAALKKFYRWMRTRYGVANPFDGFDAPRAARRQDVKWLDPGGYARWRDLGIRGMGLSGRPDQWWRGRNDQRDVAFCDGLYGTGLRVSEWASVVLPELPPYAHRRGYYTCELADACAKGGYGHPYWAPRSAMKSVLSYVEGGRAAAVRRAQATGRYERIAGLRVLLATQGTGSVTLEGPHGGTEKRSWNGIGPRTRLRLFRRTELGLEPLALWLNEDGLPRDGRGWEHTFETANERISALGLENFTCTAHMLRHSHALRWYAIGKLVYATRLGHLAEDERRDFREQFGDTWHLVQTMLGHRSVETTKNVYLEPFRALDVEMLLAHADGFPVEAFMAEVFTGHPRVRTDPLAAGR
ncbi:MULTISPECIES: site-specific integrase [unclassified Streptomyces]|uniref:site-specific integrase n=1 Tax=unclassified Streptomyces TaxID=2593676 RepID=UPI001BEAAC5F|nr:MULTISPECIES: site-specific integrase [unclassified Streptomyces]MBT2405864.1 site-specific integrase [Streptomyces sp. ISL-21]MBT2613029.1 site-specific integrase [Streptomyces sp. ISL-87]